VGIQLLCRETSKWPPFVTRERERERTCDSGATTNTLSASGISRSTLLNVVNSRSNAVLTPICVPPSPISRHHLVDSSEARVAAQHLQYREGGDSGRQQFSAISLTLMRPDATYGVSVFSPCTSVSLYAAFALSSLRISHASRCPNPPAKITTFICICERPQIPPLTPASARVTL